MTNAVENSLEKLARIIVDMDRGEFTWLFSALAEIAASIESGDLDKARQWVGVAVPKVLGLYGTIFLEVPDWCPPSMRQPLLDSIKPLRKQIEIAKTVRQHEKQEQIEREAGNPPRAN